MTETCLECGAEKGTNPKFCSSSCAAKYNNRTKPKRVPSGKCERCGTAMPKGKRYCKECGPLVQEEKQRSLDQERDNVRAWTITNGERVERSVPRAAAMRRVVFTPSLNFDARIRETSRVGELLEAVIGICFASPEYLRRSEIPRYVALLEELKRFPVRRSVFPRPKDAVIAGDVQLSSLGNVVAEWIESFYDVGHHPLMRHYALDVSQLIQFHLEGHVSWEQEEEWELKPLLDADFCRSGDRASFSPYFKKNFTERMGQILVRAVVPEKATFRDHSGNIPSDETVLFAMNRCHLSENVYDYQRIAIGFDDPSAPRFHLMRDFCFVGQYFVSRRRLGDGVRTSNLVSVVDELRTDENVRGVWGVLPGEWIADVIECDSFRSSVPPEIMPKPSWTAELKD